ncbi:MAG: HAMP domain-containing protein [Proteobacteria bacterium]|nr:HAMP domain-containing protein [Pseudomonadota bacterium]
MRTIYRRISDLLLNTTLTRKIVWIVGVIVTLVPASLVALLATVYYYIGIESLFNETIGTALSETVKVAELYLKEHKDNIRADILSVANDLDRNAYILSNDSEALEGFLNQQAYLRDLAEVMLFNKSRVISYSYLSFPLLFEQLNEKLLAIANTGEIAVLDTDIEDRVRAIIKLDGFQDTYLLVGRYIDKEILNHLHTTQGSVSQYQQLRQRVKSTQYNLIIAFIAMSAVLCMLAIVVAVKLARKITSPINLLVNATSKISSGDFSAHIPELQWQDEISTLSKSFNKMTKRIAGQTNELLHANALLDERRAFIEMVLKEISTCVLVLGIDGEISLCNDATMALLQLSHEQLVGKHYSNVMPEITDLLEKSKESPNEIIGGALNIERDGKLLHLFVRIGTEVRGVDDITSFIVTFDDTTSIVRAQKAAAWADVARRIAHEIKNPLTPIQLAAEQLRRKFQPKKGEEKELFSRYVDTITRHVDDIGNIVEDFVRFAKIPAMKPIEVDIIQLIDEIMFSYRNVSPGIKYTFDRSQAKCYTMCDKTQVSQVIVNLLKNATEAIESKAAASANSFAGSIKVACDIDQTSNTITVSVTDNGGGVALPLDRVFEPYVTTKPKGTGLGLSIVKKIVEDHGGDMSITNDSQGAVASFVLPLISNTQN